MKTFVIINGKNLHVVEQDSIQDAIIFAQNHLDMSNETIVREVNYIGQHTIDTVNSMG